MAARHGRRCIRLSARNLDALVTSLMLPVMLMLMFVYLFGGAIDTGPQYVTYVVPGVILLCAGFGSATTAVTVSQDLAGGIVDRFRSMDVGGAVDPRRARGGERAAQRRLDRCSCSRVAFLIGFRPHAGPLDWLAAVGILAAFVLAVSWLAAAIGLIAKSPEAANGFTFLIMFLPYASSAFVPVDTMPSWIQGFARAPADHPGHRDAARAAARDAGRLERVDGAGLVRRHPRRLGRRLRRAVPARGRAELRADRGGERRPRARLGVHRGEREVGEHRALGEVADVVGRAVAAVEHGQHADRLARQGRAARRASCRARSRSGARSRRRSRGRRGSPGRPRRRRSRARGRRCPGRARRRMPTTSSAPAPQAAW